MERVRHYIESILERSYFTKREKRQSAEEMEAHLHCSIQELLEQGFNPEEAIDRSLRQFGSPEELNYRLTKETYGYSGKSIREAGRGLVLLFFCSTAGGLLLSRFGVHNRYIELLPVACVVVLLLCLSLLLTRKNVDRVCLVSVPLLFVSGYLQAYFQVLVHTFVGQEFTLFQNLFFSGVFDTTGGLSNFSFVLMGVGSICLAIQSFVLYAICHNRYIALLPFGLSIILTLMHMVTFRLYALIGSSIRSPVYYGYERFTHGDPGRIVDIALKLSVCLLLFIVFRLFDHYVSQRKVRTV
ncbi:permease prefix domain 1-containing protein [Paenibacillus sp. 2TAB26]|uniref:permease prefix domain 1-containing protein n=1 Tax=Paenibacillus sp. 2TAB26 TaxID=3233005 RepID=UPI003F95F250